MFVATARFGSSLELMQRVPAAVLPKLLVRIIPTLRTAQKQEIFAEKELAKLEKMLKMTSVELVTVRYSCSETPQRGAAGAPSARRARGLRAPFSARSTFAARLFPRPTPSGAHLRASPPPARRRADP
jgi:hypothetical protein